MKKQRLFSLIVVLFFFVSLPCLSLFAAFENVASDDEYQGEDPPVSTESSYDDSSSEESESESQYENENGDENQNEEEGYQENQEEQEEQGEDYSGDAPPYQQYSSSSPSEFNLDEAYTNVPLQTPFYSLSAATFTAKGKNSALLDVKVPGLFVVRAFSSQGTSLRIIDRMFGTLGTSGQTGSSDGELILFLDKGSYKVEMFSDKAGSGTLKLLVKNAEEPEVGTIQAIKHGMTLATNLAPFVQRSYWISLKTNMRVRILAQGRNLHDLKVWHEGEWMMGMTAEKGVQENIGEGKPMAKLSFDSVLPQGYYKVSVYSLKRREWAKSANEDPFVITYGLKELQPNGMISDVVSSVGENHYIINTAGADKINTLLSGPPASAMELYTGSGDSSLVNDSSMSGSEFNAKSRFPETRNYSYSDSRGEVLVKVRGKPGTRFKLQTLSDSDRYYPKESGKYWVSAIPSGSLTDRISQSGLVASYQQNNSYADTWVIAGKDLPVIGNGQSWEDQFTCDSGLSLFFEAAEDGTYSFETTGGVPVEIRVRRYFVNATVRDHEMQNKGKAKLEKGIYVVTLSPKRVGIVNMKISASTLLPSKQAPTKRIHFQLPSVDLKSGRDNSVYYSIILNHRGDSTFYSRIVRPLPLDLRQSLPIILVPGEEVSSTFTVKEKRFLKMVLFTNNSMRLEVDGKAYQETMALSEGNHSFKLKNNSGSIAFLNLLLADKESESATITLQKDSGSYVSRLPLLRAGELIPFDLGRNDQKIFNLEVPADGFYSLKTTGRLRTRITLRSPLRPVILSAAENVDGANAEILSYLKKGLYQVAVTTLGQTRGHLGVRMNRTDIADWGLFLPDSDRKIGLKAGEGGMYELSLPTNSEYLIHSYAGSGKSVPFRLEGSDGWLVNGIFEQDQFEGPLDAGKYRLFALPRLEESRRTFEVIKFKKEVKQTGKGPLQLKLNTEFENEWNERKEQGKRIPDTYHFTLPADAQYATLYLSRGMEGELFRKTGSSALERISLPIPEGYSTKRYMLSLKRGDYVWTVMNPDIDNGVSYSTGIAVLELMEGVPMMGYERNKIQVSVGKAGPVLIGSKGSSDLSARLFDMEGKEIAYSDDASEDFNFLIGTYLQEGRYQLDLSRLENGLSRSYGRRDVPVSIFLQSMSVEKLKVPAQGLKWKGLNDGKYREVELERFNGTLRVSVKSGVETGLLVFSSQSGKTQELVSRTGLTHDFCIAQSGTERCWFGLFPKSRENSSMEITVTSVPDVKEIQSDKIVGSSGVAISGAAVVKVQSGSSYFMEGDAGKEATTLFAGSSSGVGEPALLFPGNGKILSSVDGVIRLYTEGSGSAGVRIRLKPVELAANKPVMIPLDKSMPVFFNVKTAQDSLALLISSSANFQPLSGEVAKQSSADNLILCGAIPVASSSFNNGNHSVSAAFGSGSAQTFAVWNGDVRIPSSSVVVAGYQFQISEQKSGNNRMEGKTSKGKAEAWKLVAGTKRIRISLEKGAAAVLGSGKKDAVKVFHALSGNETFETVSDADSLYIVSPKAEGLSYVAQTWTESEMQRPERILVEGIISENRSYNISWNPGTKKEKSYLNAVGQGEIRVMDGTGRYWQRPLNPVKPISIALDSSRIQVNARLGTGFNKVWTSSKESEIHSRWGYERSGQIQVKDSLSFQLSHQPQYVQNPNTQEALAIVDSDFPVVGALLRENSAVDVKERKGREPLFFLGNKGKEIVGVRLMEGAAQTTVEEKGNSAPNALVSWVVPEPIPKDPDFRMLAVGQAVCYVFEISKEEEIALGVMAGHDNVDVTLLDAEMSEKGSGPAVFRKLSPGKYFAVIRNTGTTVKVKPVMIGSGEMGKLQEKKEILEFLRQNGYMEEGASR